MRLKEILTTLHDIQVKNPKISAPFICGGIPRDKVIGQAASKYADMDITNGDDTIKYLAEEFAVAFGGKYNVKKTSANDGHVTIHLNNFKVDFSSNFMVPQIENHLKKLGIEQPTSMQKEIYSRDFTCNALLLSLDLKEISDLTGKGLADIKAKTLRTCLSPELAFAYNTNRIPRIVYLACKLGFEVDQSIIDWVKKNPKFVQQSNAKYISEKIAKAMTFDKERAVSLITQMGLWKLIPISDELLPYYQRNAAQGI